MILDLESMFSDDQALTIDAVSTNVIDLGAPGTPPLSAVALSRDIGPGTPIDILIQLTVDSGGTSPTLQVNLEKDTVEGFGSAEVVASSPILVDGVAGDRLAIQWIPDGADQRYLRLNYDIEGTTPTYTVTAGIVLGRQSNR